MGHTSMRRKQERDFYRRENPKRKPYIDPEIRKGNPEGRKEEDKPLSDRERLGSPWEKI